MVSRLSAKKLLWALIYAALPNVDCHLHDVIKGLDVSSGGTVIILSRNNILSSDDAGLSWKLLATPHQIYRSERNEIIMSPAFDEDGVIFYGGEYLSKNGGENWQVIKASRRGRWLNISCAKTHKDGIAFHPHYNSNDAKYRRRMVMMATASENITTEIWVSDDIGLDFRKLNLSPSVRNTLEEGKCPMLATMGKVTYLVTQSMAMFGTVDFGESWSVVLPAQANKEMVMQVQVDQTSAQAGHKADTLLLVTKNKVYQMKPRKIQDFPLKISAPAPVPIVLPHSNSDHPINEDATRLKNSCAKTHKDGIAFHPHYNHEIPEERRRMVMVATASENITTEIWVSDDIGLEFRKLHLSPSVRNTLEEGKCPMLATMGEVTYLVTQSMAMFGTVDFGESWSVVLPAQANKEMVMQVQVDFSTLLLVTKNKVYEVKPRVKKQFPKLKFSAPTRVPIVLLDGIPEHQINVVATHRGPGEESSTFISRTRCPTAEVCQDTSNDNVITSHNTTGHTWGTSEIKDWFALDRSGTPASHWKIPEFTDIKGVTGTPRVYIGTYSGIYRSDDGGDSWLELDTIANGATTLSISPASVNGGSFARVTTCTYRGGCFWGEVDLRALGNDESFHVADVVPQICKLSLEPTPSEPNPCYYTGRYSVSVDSPTFDIDHISLRIIGDREDDKSSQIERSTNDFADVTIPLKTKIDAETCKRTGKCSPEQSNLRIIKFSPNFKEDKTVYAAGVQGLWRSTDNGLTFERLSGIPRAEIGETCSKCDGAEWTGRDIVSLSFSPNFAKDDTMVAVSQSRFVGLLKDKRYISVSTDGGAKWTDMVWKKLVPPDPGYWTSAVIIAGPEAPEGLTVVATRFREMDYDQIFVNQANKALNRNAKWALLNNVPKHEGVGLEKGGYSGYGIALLPSGELIMSVWGGGMIVGRINKAKAMLDNIREYNTPRLGGGSNMPGSNRERNFNEQVLVSPDKRHKGVIFGVDKQDIYASVNKGATWQKVLSIPFRLPRIGTIPSPKAPVSDPTKAPTTSVSTICEDDKTFRFENIEEFSCKKYLKNKETRTARCNEWDSKFGILVKNHCPKTCTYCSERCQDDEEAIFKVGAKNYTCKTIPLTKCNKKTNKKLTKEICSKRCQFCG